MIRLTSHMSFNLATQARGAQRPIKKISQNFTSHQFTRKLLIAEILKRWLLVGKKVSYKFPNDIASKLLTLHGVNRRFVCQPKNGQFFERP